MKLAREQTLHVIDFEGSRRTGVVEFGLVRMCGHEILDTTTHLCKPLESIGPEDYRLHGISNKEADAELPFHDYWDLFNATRKAGPLAAHHASVENSFLKMHWPFPSTAPDFSKEGVTVTSWGPWADTRVLYQHFEPGLESYALGDLMESFGLMERWAEIGAKYCPEKRQKAHCALYDALASALLLMRLLEGPCKDMSIASLLIESTGAKNKRDALQQEELF